MAIAFTNESRSCKSKLQSQITSYHWSLAIPTASHANITSMPQRSWLSPGHPEIHSCYWKSTSESSLTNQYGTPWSCNGLEVGGASTCKGGMTIPESTLNSTACNHHTWSAGERTETHLPAVNRSWRSVDEGTTEGVTSRVNSHMWRSVNHCTGGWNNMWTQQTTICIPRQVPACTSGEAVETICGGMLASTTSNWRWYVH